MRLLPLLINQSFLNQFASIIFFKIQNPTNTFEKKSSMNVMIGTMDSIASNARVLAYFQGQLAPRIKLLVVNN